MKKKHSDAGFPTKVTGQTSGDTTLLKCFDWNYLEDKHLYFNIQSLRVEIVLKTRSLTATSEVPEQHEETAGSQVKITGASEIQKQNSLTFIVTVELRQIDENNTVEM